MKKNLEILFAALLAFGCCLLAGCATYKAAPQVLFDLGPLPVARRIDGLRPGIRAAKFRSAKLARRDIQQR